MSGDLLRQGAASARAWASDPDPERESDAAIHLLVADWLDTEADMINGYDGRSTFAEAVARAYLGET